MNRRRRAAAKKRRRHNIVRGTGARVFNNVRRFGWTTKTALYAVSCELAISSTHRVQDGKA